MDSPLVSIIIPVYNAEKYLVEAIMSAINQTWSNKEIIIVDDGSTDKSLTIAKGFENTSVKVFSQQNNGASAARNKGLLEAKGSYIQFLDADDVLSEDKVSEQVILLELNPGKVAVCNTVHFNNGKAFAACLPSPYEESFLINAEPVHFLINLWGGYSENGSMVQPNAWLAPEHIINKAGRWNEKLSVDDDGEFFTRVLLNSKGIVKSGGFNYYRKYAGINKSLSSLKSEKHILSQFNAAKLKYQHILKFNSSAPLKKAYLRNLQQIRFSAYPNHLSVLKFVEEEINNIQFPLKFKFAFATRVGRICSALLGWKIAKRLQLAMQLLLK